jgi:hypothetical protein
MLVRGGCSVRRVPHTFALFAKVWVEQRFSAALRADEITVSAPCTQSVGAGVLARASSAKDCQPGGPLKPTVGSSGAVRALVGKNSRREGRY